VRRVADELGTTTRTVYASLGSKDALVVGQGGRGFALLAAKVAALPRTEDPAADLVAAGVSGFRARALVHPALFRVPFQQPVTGPAEVRERFTLARVEALETLHERIRRLQESRDAGAGRCRRPPGSSVRCVRDWPRWTCGWGYWVLRRTAGPSQPLARQDTTTLALLDSGMRGGSHALARCRVRFRL